ncbi:hypothetical protein [Deinococcus roseus]|uniref:Uncharacterized protein n=1 Tax=Deinococcus roseus TaxID=392414 RepID=A0ABQ2D5P9_9DEIO|nr:hypothetical protein [Deinococcus roseus]GGJ44431.1 hypothetical protein GCM10008938_33300 [Deinococcus roseus]
MTPDERKAVSVALGLTVLIMGCILGLMPAKCIAVFQQGYHQVQGPPTAQVSHWPTFDALMWGFMLLSFTACTLQGAIQSLLNQNRKVGPMLRTFTQTHPALLNYALRLMGTAGTTGLLFCVLYVVMYLLGMLFQALGIHVPVPTPAPLEGQLRHLFNQL